MNTCGTADGLASALDLASKPNYLGSMEVVDRLLRDLAGHLIIDYGNSDTEEKFEAFQNSLPSRCETAAKVLLGMNEGYTGIPGWNAPGGIDVFVRDEMPDLTPQTEPLPVMMDAAAAFLSEFAHLMTHDAEHNLAPAAWKFEMDSIIEAWTLTFIGLSQKE